MIPKVTSGFKPGKKTVKCAAVALAAASLLSALIPLRAEEAPQGVPGTPLIAEPGRSTVVGGSTIKDELDAKTNQAVEKGLKWLASRVGADGTISGTGGDMVAISSLAGLAFLANGDMPGNGRYGRESERILDYVLRNSLPSGLLSTPNYGSPMYGHGFATLYLAEAYGQSPRPDLKEKLLLAIRLIVQTQNPQGGWRYQPLPNDADISVTICQIMALRTARNAGVKVPRKTIDLALDYVKKSQMGDGGFCYTLNSSGSMYPRSAAGVACLFYLRSGNENAEEIKRGIAYITSNMNRGGDGHFYYGNYYATQAMFMSGGNAWETYWPSIKRDLLGRQAADGNWDQESGPVYATSMALIMLQVPNRLLPILQK